MLQQGVDAQQMGLANSADVIDTGDVFTLHIPKPVASCHWKA